MCARRSWYWRSSSSLQAAVSSVPPMSKTRSRTPPPRPMPIRIPSRPARIPGRPARMPIPTTRRPAATMAARTSRPAGEAEGPPASVRVGRNARSGVRPVASVTLPARPIRPARSPVPESRDATSSVARGPTARRGVRADKRAGSPVKEPTPHARKTAKVSRAASSRVLRRSEPAASCAPHAATASATGRAVRSPDP